MAFYIFHRHRVCLVDHVDLICSLYSWWEGFESSSLAGLPLGFNCGPTPVLLPGNPMDGGAWEAAVHGVAEGRTRLSEFTFTFHFHALEKEMATHSSVLA